MLFQYAQVKRGETIMILGAAGNVVAYASQMAMDAGLSVVAVAPPVHPINPVRSFYSCHRL